MKQIIAGAYFMRELDTPEKRLAPFQVFKELRETAPVRYDDLRECWDVFLFEDVEMILKNHELFSSKHKRIVEQENILLMDPPRHHHIRNLLSKAFTLRAIRNQEDVIRRYANELLDEVIEQGRMNVIHDFSSPLPIMIISDMLGVTEQDRRKFRDWSERITKGASGTSREELKIVVDEHIRVTDELTRFFYHMMGERRRMPQNDLVTHLTEAEIDGVQLTAKEIVDFCILLLVAGNETTTNLITHAIRALVDNPYLQRKVREQPELIPQLVDETLRYYPSVLGTVRIAKEDVELRGQTIRKGDAVSVWIGSANRDPRYFDDPEAFRLDRPMGQHLSFGKGIHYCMGAPLAMSEAELALEAVLSRLTDLRLAEGCRLEVNPSPPLYGVHELPITFDTQKKTVGC